MSTKIIEKIQKLLSLSDIRYQCIKIFLRKSYLLIKIDIICLYIWVLYNSYISIFNIKYHFDVSY
jgi:hypothetical protein